MTQIGPFLALTFVISLVAFAGIVWIPGAQSPESARGLPVWMLAAWGPSLAAILLALRSGELGELLLRAVQLNGVPVSVWLIALSPVLALLVAVLQNGGLPDARLLSVGMIAKVILLNLILGPTGEELGWRGLMQPLLAEQMGWLAASLTVGAVWFAWHLPLWLVPSPQAQIPVVLFGAHVMAYAVILGAMTQLSPSIAPAILFHLAVNVMAGVALVGGLGESAVYFRVTLLPYWGIALAVAGWMTLRG